MKVRIRESTLKELELVKIRVHEPDNKVSYRYYNVIDKMLLVPVPDAKYFGLTKATIRKRFYNGTLTCYTENGEIKQNSKSTKTYFNLYEWLRKKY